jgi:hypothetical protein
MDMKLERERCDGDDGKGEISTGVLKWLASKLPPFGGHH